MSQNLWAQKSWVICPCFFLAYHCHQQPTANYPNASMKNGTKVFEPYPFLNFIVNVPTWVSSMSYQLQLTLRLESSRFPRVLGLTGHVILLILRCNATGSLSKSLWIWDSFSQYTRMFDGIFVWLMFFSVMPSSGLFFQSSHIASIEPPQGSELRAEVRGRVCNDSGNANWLTKDPAHHHYSGHPMNSRLFFFAACFG